jgi:peptide/nickel transport system ATP-binding protein
MAHDKLLAVRGLSVELRRGSTVTPIIEQVDFDVADRQVLGIIGESGSGKTVLCHALVNALNPPLEISGGSVQFAGDDILSMDNNRLHHLRGDKIAFIGSNPYSALDARRRAIG